MAKQKPKTAAKTAATTKPKYSEKELTKLAPIGQNANYDAIAFKNSQVDAVKSKMAAHVGEWNDIVDEKYAPARPKMDTNVIRVRHEGFPGGVMEDYSLRNQRIKDVYDVTGGLTGKKGVSKSAYRADRKAMNSYREDPALDSRISSYLGMSSLKKK